MKRLSEKARYRQFRRFKLLERWRAKNLRRRTKGIRRAGGERVIRKSEALIRQKVARVFAPDIFGIETEDTRQPIFDFLANLRANFSDHNIRNIVIDFSRTRRFIASGTLLFYAELTRLLEFSDGRVRVRCTDAQNSRANQVLSQIGVFDLCGRKSSVKPILGDVVHWRVAKGHMVDNTICAPAIEEIEGRLAAPLVDGIFRGLGEAMTNAKHHAYGSVRKDGLNFVQPRQDWWMFSQLRGGFLSVVFCDLGVGIPATLPAKQPHLFARLLALGKSSSDAACIAEAIQNSRSSTQIEGRGHGLGNIINVISKAQNGTVMVMSNRGFYSMRKGQKPIVGDYKRSIMGTLIYWRVPEIGVLNDV